MLQGHRCRQQCEPALLWLVTRALQEPRAAEAAPKQLLWLCREEGDALAAAAQGPHFYEQHCRHQCRGSRGRLSGPPGGHLCAAGVVARRVGGRIVQPQVQERRAAAPVAGRAPKAPRRPRAAPAAQLVAGHDAHLVAPAAPPPSEPLELALYAPQRAGRSVYAGRHADRRHAGRRPRHAAAPVPARAEPVEPAQRRRFAHRSAQRLHDPHHSPPPGTLLYRDRRNGPARGARPARRARQADPRVVGRLHPARPARGCVRLGPCCVAQVDRATGQAGDGRAECAAVGTPVGEWL